jgi:hypothetical protein
MGACGYESVSRKQQRHHSCATCSRWATTLREVPLGVSRCGGTVTEDRDHHSGSTVVWAFRLVSLIVE